MDTTEIQILKNKYNIVGNDATLNLAIETAGSIAPTDLTVLITGESGVGKDVIPRVIHDLSTRKHKKYLAINCAAIPEGTINAELFGHVKGAFTGAIGDRKGYFEEANGGTIFLDEVGELPKETQALLLRVLQSGEYMKVGSSEVEKTDVRVIVATNVNLWDAVCKGKFRADLYYRLNAVQIVIPSLRERKEDIYLLFRKFSSDFSERYNYKRVTLSHDAIVLLSSYRWPGNIRQLKNFAERVTALEGRAATPASPRVELDSLAIRRHLPDEKDSLLPATMDTQTGQTPLGNEDKNMIIKAILDLKNEVDDLSRRLAIVEQNGSIQVPLLPDNSTQTEEPEWQEGVDLNVKKASDEIIFRALEKHAGNIKAAAAELGISERTIYRKIKARKQQ